jgi:hypothetical protein
MSPVPGGLPSIPSTWNLEYSGVISPLEEDRLQTFFHTALDISEPTGSSANHSDSFLGHGLQRSLPEWANGTCPKELMANNRKLMTVHTF